MRIPAPFQSTVCCRAELLLVMALVAGCGTTTAPAPALDEFRVERFVVIESATVVQQEEAGTRLCALAVQIVNISNRSVRELLLDYSAFDAAGELVAATARGGAGALGFNAGQFPPGATVDRTLIWLDAEATTFGSSNPGGGGWLRECDAIASVSLSLPRSGITLHD